ncbi:hypothetical protein PtrM4_101160 [Pyrenophora tritici-repentis]|uniref:Uncharacterized protein n=1 Tax=Pyrenophora tritici-repentis TaxID=45151 RepID=A0A834VPH0_9PLEO|nr:hypothetical protein PtrM4_101160 [Pyrenophora tritici-repentis]
MSDNENGENGDELVTKPFKFVTAGTPPPKPHCDLKRPRNSRLNGPQTPHERY